MRLKKDLDKRASLYEQQLYELKEMVKKMDKGKRPRFVINRKSRITHRVLAGYEEVGPRAIAMCGWRYVHSYVALTHEEPKVVAETCDTCLPALRALLALGSQI